MSTETGDRRRAREAVLEILSDALSLPADELLRRQELAECGWDSVAALETIVALEGRFGIELDLRALLDGQTADDLVRLVRKALA